MLDPVQMPTKGEEELRLRRRLGIPTDARQVLVFAESSHWDPNWLRTSEAYYKLVRRNLDLALQALERHPRRVYSVECLFFLRMYWERSPEKQAAIRALVNEGRLRLTSSGVTTADTILPNPEAILRDLLLGQEWLRTNGMTQEPRLAYFADSFGCSPALPSLLRAAGFDQTGLTRVDGMFFPGTDYQSTRRLPRRGSSAEQLLRQERTLDFVWRGPDGAEVLCHWNAFTYGQGDLLAHIGITRSYLFPSVLPARSGWAVARRVGQFAARLGPYSRTPYLFCPIGFDFVAPIRDLVPLLDRYNQQHYPHTGVWTVNAGLDDYLALVDCHRDRLPVLELDPNPYWTGFYTSRPALKEKAHELVRLLLLAERLALLPENEPDPGAEPDLEQAWWTAAVANHHDFITGTSPNHVVEREQEPWLQKATDSARAAVTRLSAGAGGHARRLAWRRAKPLEWGRRNGSLEVETPYYSIKISEEAGGAIVRACLAGDTQPLLTDFSNDLISYRDSGGLWRMGHEFWGGGFKEAARASDRRACLVAQEREDGLEVAWESELGGEWFRRRMWLPCDSPLIRFRIEGRAPKRRTVTVRFHTGLSARELAMDAPGGVVVRPLNKIYNPTFWPIQRFCHVQDAASGRGAVFYVRLPSATACWANGRVEAIALRNATHEHAFGIIPFLGTLAWGYERSYYAFEYALSFTAEGDWQHNRVSITAQGLDETPWGAADGHAVRALAASIVHTDRSEVAVTAVKRASRGEGWIVRLYTHSWSGRPVTVNVYGQAIQEAFLCDARERDLHHLPVRDGATYVTMPGNIATVRLLAGVG